MVNEINRLRVKVATRAITVRGRFHARAGPALKNERAPEPFRGRTRALLSGGFAFDWSREALWRRHERFAVDTEAGS